ncbi:MAG: hypothetical protein AMXMBFR84_26270 [Candidatus Hydrogenedentota bacterium]
MKIFETDRGFRRAEFQDKYRSHCVIQESSLATDNCIHFGVNIDFNGDKSASMHLNQKMVKKLLPLLEHFAKFGNLPAPSQKVGKQ